MMCKSSFKNAFLTLTGRLPPFLDPSPPPQAPQLAPNQPVAQDDALPATPPAASDSDHSEYELSRPVIRKRRHPSPSTVRSKKTFQDDDSTPNSDKDPNKEESSRDARSFQQGMRVLIFYDNQYCVGEVLHTLPEDFDRNSIAFMEQVPKQNIFRWNKEDFDTVQRKFVMELYVPVAMASWNGRTWSLSNFARAEAIYYQWNSSLF